MTSQTDRLPADPRATPPASRPPGPSIDDGTSGTSAARPSPLQSGRSVRGSLLTTSPTTNPGGDLAPGGPAASGTPPPSQEG